MAIRMRTETHRQEVEALAVSFRHQHSGVNRQARLRLQAHLHEGEPATGNSVVVRSFLRSELDRDLPISIRL